MVKNPFGRLNTHGQALVEFAIALPVLLLLLYGIMEFGRAILIYALVNNASRDAVRYASAYGMSENGYLKYKYCDGIKTVAQQSAFIAPLTSITITYDSGPGTSSLGTCTATGGEDTSVSADTGDRVTVAIQGSYAPIIHIKLFDLGATRTITSTSSRTILGLVKLNDYP